MGRRFAVLFLLVVGASFAVWMVAAPHSPPIGLSQTLPQVSEPAGGSGGADFSLHLTLEVELEPGLVEDRWLVEIWQKGEDHLRLEVLESSIPVLRGLTLVRNGSKAKLSGPNTADVVEGEPEKVRLPLAHEIFLETLELVRRADFSSPLPSPQRGEVKILSAEFNLPLEDSLFTLESPEMENRE